MSDQRSFPLERGTGYARVELVLETNGLKLVQSMVLDTGAAQTTLSEGVARRLGVELTSLPTQRMQTAGGLAQSWLWRPAQVELLDQVVSNPPLRFALSLPMGVPGLLGNDLLSAAGLVLVVNYPKRVARLIRPR